MAPSSAVPELNSASTNLVNDLAPDTGHGRQPSTVRKERARGGGAYCHERLGTGTQVEVSLTVDLASRKHLAVK